MLFWITYFGWLYLPCIDWCVHSTSQPSLSYEQQFLDRVDNIYLYEHIVRSTWARNVATPSILDPVIAKSVDDVLTTDFRLPLGKRDNVLFEIYMNTNVQREGVNTLRYNYINADYESIKN